MTWAEELREAFPDSVVTAASGEPPIVVVQPDVWHDSVAQAATSLQCDYFDFLTAAEEPGGRGYRIVCHLARLGARPENRIERLLLQTLVGRDEPRVASVADLFAGAAWHEREMHEMYGVVFEGGDQRPLLLDGSGTAHPLRKEVLLPARSARPWPGAKEPGESDADASPSRRRLRPPGVPEEPRR